MSTIESLENSHMLVLQTIDDLPEALWDIPGVCGEWSAKDVIAHLTSYELLLIDVMDAFLGRTPSPYLLKWLDSQEEFNTMTLAARRYHTAQQIENEYQDTQVRSSALLASLPADRVEQRGTMTGYLSKEQSLGEFIEFLTQHTHHHCEQIVQFREKNKMLE
jgi:uncharacterized damage-inducible protein DinB